MHYDYLSCNEIQFAPLNPVVGIPGYYIVYSPLTGTALIASNADLAVLEGALKCKAQDGELEEGLKETVELLTSPGEHAPQTVVIDAPEKYTKLSLLPNFTCNFSCSYCYSAKGRSQQVVDREALATMIDFFVDRKRTGDSPLSIFISGGGEPLLSWDKVEFAVSRARELAAGQGIQLEIWLMTNGSHLSDQIIRGLLEHEVNVGVSFELLEDVQNRQRGKFAEVAENIRTMLRNGITPSISSVITLENVKRMEEMVDVAAQDFSGVKHLNFDPAMTSDLFSESGKAHWFYQTFLDGFFKVRQKAHAHGMTFDCNMIRKFEGLYPRYCQGKLCLTPEGKISVCHSISSPKEKDYEKVIYGDIHDGKVRFDRTKFASLIAPQANFTAGCYDCIAKWHCGGGCLMYRANYDNRQMELFCDFTRNMVIRLLLLRLDIQYRENMGLSLEEFLQQQTNTHEDVSRTE